MKLKALAVALLMSPIALAHGAHPGPGGLPQMSGGGDGSSQGPGGLPQMSGGGDGSSQGPGQMWLAHGGGGGGGGGHHA